MYKVMVDDNFHYQDPEERYEVGSLATFEEALAACRQRVDRSLAAQHRPGMAADALYERYRSFGEDPFIVATEGSGGGPGFSAWSYARERCSVICGADGTAGAGD